MADCRLLDQDILENPRAPIQIAFGSSVEVSRRSKTYSSYNHLFVTGTGVPRPEEYERPGHLDPAVLQDLSTWILGPKGGPLRNP